jgi:hypothetical protein
LRFLLDEDTERRLADLLARDGHDVERVVEVDALGGGADDLNGVLPYAKRTDRIVLTYDDDFTAYDREAHAGVFYCPDQRRSTFELYRIVSAVADAYPSREAMPPVVFLTGNWI